MQHLHIATSVISKQSKGLKCSKFFLLLSHGDVYTTNPVCWPGGTVNRADSGPSEDWCVDLYAVLVYIRLKCTSEISEIFDFFPLFIFHTFTGGLQATCCVWRFGVSSPSLASGQFNRGQSPTWAFTLFMIMNHWGTHVASCCPIHHLAKVALNQLKGNSKWPKVASTELMIHSCHCATMNWETTLFYIKTPRKPNLLD